MEWWANSHKLPHMYPHKHNNHTHLHCQTIHHFWPWFRQWSDCIHDHTPSTFFRKGSRIHIYIDKSCGCSLMFVRLWFCSLSIDDSGGYFERIRFLVASSFLCVSRSCIQGRTIACIGCRFFTSFMWSWLCLSSLIWGRVLERGRSKSYRSYEPSRIVFWCLQVDFGRTHFLDSWQCYSPPMGRILPQRSWFYTPHNPWCIPYSKHVDSYTISRYLHPWLLQCRCRM